MTFMSVTEDPVALIFMFVSSCAIRPEKRLKVRGMRIYGLISINTFLLVRM